MTRRLTGRNTAAVHVKLVQRGIHPVPKIPKRLGLIVGPELRLQLLDPLSQASHDSPRGSPRAFQVLGEGTQALLALRSPVKPTPMLVHTAARFSSEGDQNLLRSLPEARRIE